MAGLAIACAALLGCGSGQSIGAPGTATPPAGATPYPGAASTADPTSTPSPSAVAGEVRVPLSGAAPDAIVADGDTAWVLTGEGGTLIEVDLDARAEVRAIDVGFGATHVALPLAGVAAVGRFDNSSTGAYCLLVDLETGDIRPVQTGELGALTAGETGVVWALEKADRLVKFDATTGEVLGSTRVEVGENVHVEVRWAGGAAWVGSDGLPLVRVDGDDLDEHRTIEVDEGIPFLFEGGLVWGAGPSQLWALDPATGEIMRRIALENLIEVLALDIDGDDAWIAARHPGHVGTVLHLDLASEAVVEEIPIDLPAAVAIAPERVWVASYSTKELVGIER
jgi:outer membrane protein assembly factor BamB